jgi:hypothetical protein
MPQITVRRPADLTQGRCSAASQDRGADSGNLRAQPAERAAARTGSRPGSGADGGLVGHAGQLGSGCCWP